MVGIWSHLIFPIVQGTLPWQPILRFKVDKSGLFTFLRRHGIPQRIAMSQFRLQTVHSGWSGYIV